MSPAPIVRFPEPGEIPSPHRLGGPVEQREYVIDGELRRWDGPVQPIDSPVCHRRDGVLDQARVGVTPRLDQATARSVLDAAAAAYGGGQGAWPMLPVAARIDAVEQFLFRMQEQREPVVRLLMWEVAKSLRDSEREFDRTVAYVRDTIGALKDLDRAGSRFSIEEGIIGQIRRAPLGVALCMGPYNYPLNETFTTLIPALIMGNTVVFKPPRFGQLLYQPLLRAFAESFPKGVVNVVYGDGREVAGPLMETGSIDVLAFIGTSRVADILKKQHPRPHRLRSVLGLEAKNAAIVLRDADLDLAVRECVLGTLSFNGQRCTALKLLFVHEQVADAFLERLSGAISALVPGMPWDDGVSLTPLPETGKTGYLAGLVADAADRGARVVNPRGGESLATYFHPAVLFPVDASMRVFHEEQFGPVIPVVPFDDVGSVVGAIAGSSYGQQVSLFGSDPRTLAPLIDVMVNQVCRVNLNCQCQRGPDTFPFTGRKDSAEGTLSVSDALRVFSIRTLVAARQLPLNERLVTSIVRERQSAFLSTDFIF